MKHYVTLAVSGTITVEVDVDYIEYADEAACEATSEVDFGALENIEWRTINVE